MSTAPSCTAACSCTRGAAPQRARRPRCPPRRAALGRSRALTLTRAQADRKSTKGKLRLLYECFPMAYLVERGGGRAISARGRPVLDLQPEKIHERSPIFLGSKADVDRIEELLPAAA